MEYENQVKRRDIPVDGRVDSRAGSRTYKLRSRSLERISCT